VTFCFYTAVHVINAHLAKKANLHYRTHEDVKNAINPTIAVPICAVPDAIYLSYLKLENLSRRARYLCTDDKKGDQEIAYLTYDKHFAKATRHLDNILDHFAGLYAIQFYQPILMCQQYSGSEKFKVLKVRPALASTGRA
jgi:hypothetical protein